MTTQLLELLRGRAIHRRIALARSPVLQEALSCSLEELEQALAELTEAGMVEILTPLPYLVIAFPSKTWSGKTAETARMPSKSGPAEDRAYSSQSSLSQSQQLTKESYRRPAEDEALLQEILETLGETNPTTFRGAIENYPAGVIRIALARIRRMKNIRKNRTALFRFLLPRIAKELPLIK